MDWQAVSDARAGERLFPIDTADGRAWFKRDGKDYRNRLQRWLGRLASPHAPSQLEELTCLRAVAARGMTVPPIIAEGPGYFILGDLGPTLDIRMRELAAEVRPTLARQAAQTLRQLHDAGGWHGNAALRNMTLAPNGAIGLFDFEGSSRPNWSLRLKQSYDLWQLAYSTTRIDRSGGLAREVLRAFGRGPVWRALHRRCMPLIPVFALFWPMHSFLKKDFDQILVTFHAVLADWIA